jgi:hypothetical protein
LRHAALVLPAIATALGLRPSGPEPYPDLIARRLADGATACSCWPELSGVARREPCGSLTARLGAPSPLAPASWPSVRPP